MNPDVFIFDREAIDLRGELVVTYSLPFTDAEDLPKDQLQRHGRGLLEHSHTLEDQVEASATPASSSPRSTRIATEKSGTPFPVHACLLRHTRS